MPITAMNPPAGAVGTEVEIQGSGFTNSTGVRFTGLGAAIAAAMLVVSDSLIRATVPPDAVTGPVTVLDPEGNMTSQASFNVLAGTVPTLPENSTRGRAAINAIVLAIAAKQRNDRVTVVNTFAREVFFLDVQESAALQPLIRPSGPAVTDAQVTEYQNNLFARLPAFFDLVLCRVYGSLVLLSGWSDAAHTRQVHYLLKQTGDDFEIVTMNDTGNF